ncbi:MAG: hypothetical protein HY238_15170 [Acidobacteria bacterium]|nr:hypothetical protein [Acidobacteriota bacterium]
MRWSFRGVWAALAAMVTGLLLAQASGPGDGSPTSAILGYFLQAFARGTFSTSVVLPPKDKVHRNGPGYVQDFDPLDPTQGSYVLAKPDSAEAAYQMCCQILALHTAIGSFSGNVGFPVSDPIPGLVSVVDAASSVQQNFDSGYVLIYVQNGSLAGQSFYIKDPYVSRWRITPALGLPIDQEHDTTSRFSTTGTQQDFQGGMVVQITSGSRKDQVYTVSGTIYAKYNELGQIGSFLGYPIGDEFPFSGRQRQNFEGGYVDYVPGSNQPAEAHAPVLSVVMDAAPVTLQVGNIIQRTATVFDNLGNPLTNQPVSWTTSNQSVIQIQASGATATLRAVGPGFANVVAFSSGVSSGTLRITVTSACCLVGEGAPNSAVRQAMLDALARNNIAARLPADNPVRRLGAGYVQELTALTPATLGRLLVVKADASAQAFVVSGQRLARYADLGGVVGPLGFATSDSNAAGRQLFENNYALAGSPPTLVGAPISRKWAALNYESGPAGLPSAEVAAPAPTPFGSAGVSQAFANGAIYGFTSGSRAGQAYFVSGLILARYLRLSGASGVLGLPISDAFASGGRTQQNFEGGSIDFAAGDAEAVEHLAARTPAVTILPSQVPIGGRVRISINGFTPGRKLAVSITSQPDFEVTPSTGAYWWDQQIRPGATAGVYRVTARDAAGTDRAEATYRIRTAEEVRYQLAKFTGDNQSGLPGSEAAQPLVVRLTDEAGVPIAGARVTFGSIAGAAATPGETSTDADGFARARLRLPLSTGLVLATAEAANRTVTFSARAEDGRLTSFPTFRQSIDDLKVGNGAASIHKKGSLLTALAALFRYYQDRGELASKTALAEPATLNQFLLDGGYLPFTLNGRAELVLNLPRALGFVSDAADFETVSADPLTIRDSLNQRRPVLLGLLLGSAGQDRGAHYVVATGVGPDGSILIYDPSPDWNRTSLNEYLNGFTALGHDWTATLLHGLRLRLEPRSPRGFLVHGPGAAALRVTGIGGRAYRVSMPALAAFDEYAVLSGSDTADLWYLDGGAPQYQMSAAAGGVVVRGPAVSPPLGPGVFRIDPDPASFAVTAQTLTASAAGMRNAAGFGARLAPGSLASLFGSGLAEALTLPLRFWPTTLGGLSISVGGQPAPLLFVLPFQANLQLPFGLSPGTQPVEVTSKFGTVRFDITLDEAAPGIFTLFPDNAGAVLNQDFALNTTLSPALRNTVLQVYTTGLGAVAPSVTTGSPAPASPLLRATATVTATLDGQPAQVLFAGLAPGFAGLYQVNVLIPASLAPNAAARLVIRAGGQESNVVTVAVQ